MYIHIKSQKRQESNRFMLECQLPNERIFSSDVPSVNYVATSIITILKTLTNRTRIDGALQNSSQWNWQNLKKFRSNSSSLIVRGALPAVIIYSNLNHTILTYHMIVYIIARTLFWLIQHIGPFLKCFMTPPTLQTLL
jgi:hypothetical protein